MTDTIVRRHPERADYEREAIDAILDEGLVGHLGFVAGEQPYVIPMLYARAGDTLYLHGAPASRLLGTLADGAQFCLTVTLLDGLVLARSVFNHSMNYRSVVILGKATLVDYPEEKLAALRILSEHIIPGRWDDARQPNERELKATSVLRLPIKEFSAKIRTGPPIDEEEDYSFPTWAGVVPLEMKVGVASNDPRLDPGREVPAYVRNYSRGRR